MSDLDKIFAGSIPKLYDTHLVPLIFEPYAADLKRSSAMAVRVRTRHTDNSPKGLQGVIWGCASGARSKSLRVFA